MICVSCPDTWISNHIMYFEEKKWYFRCLGCIFLNHHHHHNIFPSFPSVLASVTASPAAANGPTDMIFGMKVCFDYGMLIFGKSRSRVKGQGRKSTKICLFWADFGHRGYVWGYSGPGRVRWGTYGSMPTNFGKLPKVIERREASCRWVSKYWQVASVAGKVPK